MNASPCSMVLLCMYLFVFTSYELVHLYLLFQKNYCWISVRFKHYNHAIHFNVFHSIDNSISHKIEDFWKYFKTVYKFYIRCENIDLHRNTLSLKPFPLHCISIHHLFNLCISVGIWWKYSHLAPIRWLHL